MSELSIAIAFLFFTLSFARTPLSEPENDITHLKIPDTLQESDPTTTLNQYDKETQHVQDLPEPKAKDVKALPLTFVGLRPINRHFRIRSRHPFRLSNHHNHHHAHNLNPRTHLDQIPYDKDMIHSSGENSDFEDVMLPEDMPQVQEEWISFLHHNHHLHDDDDDEHKMSRFLIKRGNHDKFAKLKLKSQFYDPLDDDEDEDDDEDDKTSAMQHEDHHSSDKKKLKKHLNHHHEEEEQEAEEENESHKQEKKTGSFMKRIRKFLDPYLD